VQMIIGDFAMPTKPAESHPASTNGAKFSVAQIPTLRNVSKEVVDIEGKIAQMSARRAQLEAERIALRKEALNLDPDASAKRRKSKDDAMLATALGFPTTGPADLSPEHSRVVEQIDVLNLALSKMQVDLDRAKLEASFLVCQQFSDVHASLAREIAISLLAVHRACVEYQAFASAMEGRDVAWAHLKPAFPRFIGHPGDNYSPIALYLRSAVEADRVTFEELPEYIRFG
jgi:hypothetical protein